MDKTFDELFESLIAFIHWLANQKQSSQTVMLEYDEIIGELSLEFVIGVKRYGNKPKNECMAILRTMMDNRIAELMKKYHYTHHALGLDLNTVPLDYIDDNVADDADDSMYVHCQYQESVTNYDPSIDEEIDYLQIIKAMRQRLSKTALEVFDVLIGESVNPLVMSQIILSTLRARHIFSGGGTIRLHTWQIADALVLPESEVKRCVIEIQKVYDEVAHAI